MSLSNKNKTVLSLFSGCGGMDLGFEGDFEVLGASVNQTVHPDWIIDRPRPGWVRIKPTCFVTVFANDVVPSAYAAWAPFFKRRGGRPNKFHLGSIVDLVKAAKNGEGNVFPKSADVVTGGFPCQDFSVAGKRKGFDSHKSHTGDSLNENLEPTINNRGMLYMWMREVIDMVRPKVFVAENVKGLISLADAKEFIERDFRRIGGYGYVVVPARILRAVEYGVPQTRERVFFLGFLKSALTPGALKALEFTEVPIEYDPYPPPTHFFLDSTPILPNLLNNLLPAVTAGNALVGLGEPSEDIDDDSHKAISRAKFMGAHCQGQTEVRLNLPGPTIRAEHHGNIEFRRLSREHGGKIIDELNAGLPERRLTVRECARLQTFPDDFEFVRVKPENPELKITATNGYKLVGNAVPPLLTYHIAARLSELWVDLFGEEVER